MNKGTLIIGNGIAGITAARHLRKLSDTRIQVISAESPWFFSRTALMYVYMGHMEFQHIKPYEDWFWSRNRIELIQARVESIQPAEKTVKLDTGEVLGYDQLVLATGSKTRYFNWKGQNCGGVQGLVSLQDLQLLEKNTPAPFQKHHPVKKAVVNGGGLIGVELAEMMNTRALDVAMLVREDRFWGGVLTPDEGRLIGKHIESHGVKIHCRTELDEIIAGPDGRVASIRTKKGEEMPCQILGIATGVEPNIDFLRGSGLETDEGILVNQYLETNLPDVYAIGDCAQMRQPAPNRKPIEAVWYVGRMMGEVVAQSLAGRRTPYLPGPWFNSAKFFDIEYQTYGKVQPNPDDQQMHWFWQGNEKKFITIAYHPDTKVFQGINSFGIRLRHTYFDNAIKRKMKVGEVVGGIKSANFDAEFYKKWYKPFIRDFQNQTDMDASRPSFLKQLLIRT